MISREYVLDAVKDVICEVLYMHEEDVTEDLHREILCDDLDYVMVLMELEKKLDVAVDDDAANKVNTVGELVDLFYSVLNA